MYLGSDLLDSADLRLDERFKRVLLAVATLACPLCRTRRPGQLGELFARSEVLPHHLVIVLRGSPHFSHRRGRRPCLIHLGRAVLVDVPFKVLQLDTQKCSPLDKALHQSEFIFGHRRQNLPKPLLLRFDSLISCHLLLSSHISTAHSRPKNKGVAHTRPSSKLE